MSELPFLPAISLGLNSQPQLPDSPVAVPVPVSVIKVCVAAGLDVMKGSKGGHRALQHWLDLCVLLAISAA